MLNPRGQDDGEPRGRPRRASLAVLGIPAVAIILALVLRWSTPTGGLVTYELEVASAKTQVQGVAGAEEAAAPRVALEPGQPLTLLLRPHEPFKEAIEAHVFVERQPGSLRREPVPFATEALPGSPGALRLTLDSRQLPARGRVLILIGRPGSVPAIPTGTAAHGRNWQRFDVDFEQQTPSTSQP